MKKHYDNYLCRANLYRQHAIRTDQYGRMYTWIGTDKYFLSTPYPAGDIEICDLTPAECTETQTWVANAASWSLSIIIVLVFVGMIIKYISQ